MMAERFFLVNGGFPVCMKDTDDGGLSIMAWDTASGTMKRAPRFAGYIMFGRDEHGDVADVEEVSREAFDERVAELSR